MSSNIKIRTFSGTAAKTYIPSIAKLRTEVFREYPFLCIQSLEYEKRYLKKFTQCKDAIVILVFDGSKIVGASTGLPLEEEGLEVQKPFLAQGCNPADYFCFGESVLLKEYRGRGLGHHFFELREAHAKNLKRFHHICFYTLSRPPNHPLRPPDYMPLENFWRKRGYIVHPELSYEISWQDVHEEKETPKPLNFWIKDIA